MPNGNQISGNQLYVKLDEIVYKFSEWTLTVDPGSKLFYAAGSKFQQALPGGFKGSIEIAGAYDQGAMPLTPGTIYTFHLGIVPGVEFALDAMVGPVKYKNQIAGSDPMNCTFTADSDGDFDIDFT